MTVGAVIETALLGLTWTVLGTLALRGDLHDRIFWAGLAAALVVLSTWAARWAGQRAASWWGARWPT